MVIALLGLIIFGLWKAINLSLLNYKAELRLETVPSVLRFRSRIEEIYARGPENFKGQPLVRLVSPGNRS